MKEKDLEKILNNINATMAMEDMNLSTSEQQLIVECLVGDKNFDDEIDSIINQYKNI